MDPEPKPTQAQTVAGLPLGKFGELVFDDEPLEPLLAGTEPIAPTPASILKIWGQGIDRSQTSVRALLAVLSNSREPPLLGNLDGAEECLREVIESGVAKSEREFAACCCSLGRLLHLKGRTEEAEQRYRQALEIQERVLGIDDETTAGTAEQLFKLLKQANRHDEATRFLQVMKARRLAGKSDDSSLWEIRQIALDMVLAGQHAEAEAIYRRLLEKRFAPGSTYCHLARIFLMTDRDAEAREAVEQAWRLKGESPTYAIARIQFLRTLMPMLGGQDWKPNLLELKTALSAPEVHMIWTMEPVLDHLKARLGDELHTMLTAILAAIGSRAKMKDLNANPTWRAVCGGDESSPATESSVPANPDNPAQMQLSLPTETTRDVDAPASTLSLPEQAVDEAERFSFGTVVRVSGDCVTVREYDFAKEADVDHEYHVNERTEFGNATKLDDLMPGDSVVVDFSESDGKSVITVLIREVPEQPASDDVPF